MQFHPILLIKADCIEEAKQFLAKASNEFELRNYGSAGLYYRKAGELFSQYFCTYHPVYNLQYHDYSQDYGEGWYAIELDLHF